MAKSASSPAASPRCSSLYGERSREGLETDIAAYYFPTPPPPPPHANGVGAYQQLDGVQVYEPEAYIAKLASNSDCLTPFAKRQRVDSPDPNQLSSLPSCAYDQYGPAMAHAPTASASVSSLPSQNSATSSEAMSRQSSVSTSMTDTFDMMRVESSFSNYSVDHHPLAFDEDLAASFVSNVMETPGSSLVASFGFDEASCNKQFLSDVGYGFAGQPLSFIDTFNTANAVCRQDHSALRATFSQPQTQGMRRTVSKHATPSTSSADLKASQRRRKHIENAKQNTNIAPKRQEIPLSPNQRVANDLSSALSPQDPNPKRKTAIAKASYVRPQHPKQYCTLCDEHPHGFRGDHELRRHHDRAHAQRHKVWICVAPPTTASK